MSGKKYSRHYEESVNLHATSREIFTFANNHQNFSSHMSQSSWMMGGGKMNTEVDDGGGQKIGSHIRMKGTVFRVNLYLDEVIVEYNPPYSKAWETVGDINLIVIDNYKLGFVITEKNSVSEMKVYIDYDLPHSWKTKLLGRMLSGMYAKWCVSQMSESTKKHFDSVSASK